MKIKINILLIILLLSTTLFVACKKDPEIEEPLNQTEIEEDDNNYETDNDEEEIVDDKETNNLEIISMDMAIEENGSVLVPARLFSEKLGAEVTWNSGKQTMLIEKEENSVLFKIGSRLINYNNGKDYELSDAKPRLLGADENNNLIAYIPLKTVSTALNMEALWNEDEKNIYINHDKEMENESTSIIQIISQNKDETINGKTIFQVNTKKEYEKDSEIQFMILDKGDTSGFLVEKGKEITKEYAYIPKMEDNGQKILVAMVYNKNGEYLDGDAIPVEINIKPEVNLLGINNDDIITSTVDLSTKTNFLPLYVKYEITELNESGEGNKILTDLTDPLGTFTWNPNMNSNKSHSIRAVAYDAMENPYYSQSKIVIVNKERILTLGGVKENMTIDKEINLIANRNFDVSETEYLMRDINTGNVSTIAKIPYGAYKWNPSPEDSGVKELFVRVVDRGNSYESNPVRVTVNGEPKIFLEGIGPGEVVNKTTTLSMNSNVDMENVKYILTDPNTNNKREIVGNETNSEALYTPIEAEKDNMIIEVQGQYKGNTIFSEKVKFKVYHGEFYGPKAIVEKEEFIPLTSKLALNTYENIGMSAALQTAQAILESGWGQSVPVDKYTGVLSNNLFGIKGKGTVGSVTSNTWEVYNGITYRIDDNFRAYNNLNESWNDHKALLLNADRYKPFTEVMYDYTRGAWAIKRAGYATDPMYPIKLINIIYKYGLVDLDKIEI
ncbi:MAG TPA: glucosaminidase domain-containing protein [Tissierellaceae bacterium]|nr:glucosaminidase domain-containing protein [Tissierellaceae bacterium]